MNVSWLELQSQRMDPRTDVQSGQRYQHISRAVWLQSRWQEVSERERRAQLHNRKLLQDFQRAQETLSDLVARTEAMNTIRVEYERYLEENFPRWQQKLKDKRLSEQRKRIEEHLKACIQQMEEDQRIEWGNNSPVRTNSSSCISPDLSHPPIPHPDHRDMRREVHAGMPRSASSQQNNKQNIQGNVHNGFQHFSLPFTWLTQPSVSEPQRSDIPKETKTFQNTHQTFNSPGDPRYGPYPIVRQESPYNDHLRPYPKAWAGGVQCDPAGALWSVLPFVNPLVWRMGLSDSTAEGMQCSEEVEGEKQKKSSSSPQVEKHQAKKQRRKLNGGDQSSELDTKSVHLSSNNGDSSESRALSCDAVTSFASGMQKRKKERRREKQTHKPTVEKETVSWSSSSMSNVHSGMNNEKDMSSLSSPVRRPFKNHKVSKAKVKSTAGVESPEHPGEESEQEGKRNQETLKSSGSEVEKKKKKKRNEYNKKDHMEQMDHKDQEVSAGVEGCLSEDRGSKGGEEEERAGTGHTAQDEEEWTEGLHVKKNDSGDRDGDETDGGVEDKALSNNASEGGSVSEKLVNYVGESGVDDEEEEENKDGGGEEEEDGEKEENKDGVEEEDEEDGGEEEDKEEEEEDLGEEESKDGGDDDEKDEDEKEEEAEEINVEVGAPRGRKGGDDESDEEVNDSEVAASGSGSNMYDSLKELYKDEETEDEELYDQEIEDDTDDDDDNVVVEKAHPLSHDPTYDHTKYQDDDYDDDVEGLLAPQDNVQQHQADEAEETVKPTDLHSDSEEDGSQRKAPSAPVKDEPVDSDDEFDHFYD